MRDLPGYVTWGFVILLMFVAFMYTDNAEADTYYSETFDEFDGTRSETYVLSDGKLPSIKFSIDQTVAVYKTSGIVMFNTDKYMGLSNKGSKVLLKFEDGEIEEFYGSVLRGGKAVYVYDEELLERMIQFNGKISIRIKGYNTETFSVDATGSDLKNLPQN